MERGDKIYPNRPNRPLPPQFLPNRRLHQQKPGITSSLLGQFRTAEGKMDFEKIQTTAQQTKQIYDQVSPFISKFLKK